MKAYMEYAFDDLIHLTVFFCSGSQSVWCQSLFLFGGFWLEVSMWSTGNHGGLMVDFCASGQDQFNQCRETQTHYCQNQPGLLLQILHSRAQGEVVYHLPHWRAWGSPVNRLQIFQIYRLNIHRYGGVCLLGLWEHRFQKQRARRTVCVCWLCVYTGTVECGWGGWWCLVSFSGEGIKAQVALYSLRQNFHLTHFTQRDQCSPWLTWITSLQQFFQFS